MMRTFSVQARELGLGKSGEGQRDCELRITLDDFGGVTVRVENEAYIEGEPEN